MDNEFQAIAASLSHDKVAEVSEAFSLFDTDGDGEITVKELGTVLRSVGQTPSEQDMRRLLAEVDKDENGTVDFAEFLLLMVRTPAIANVEEKGSLRAGPTYTALDASGGIAGCCPGTQGLNSNQILIEYSAEEMLEPFQEYDTEKSGWISKKDFLKVMAEQGDALNMEEVAEMFENAIHFDSSAAATPQSMSMNASHGLTRSSNVPMSSPQSQADLTREASTALQIDNERDLVNYEVFVRNLLHAAEYGSSLFD